MKCKKIKRLVSLYIDGEIKPAKQRKMFAHLETCEDCQKEKNTLEFLNRLLLPPEPLQPSPQFLSKVKQGITSADGIGSYTLVWLKYLKPALASMASVLIFLLFFLVGNSLGTRLIEKDRPGTMEKNLVRDTFNKTMNITIFDDIPRGTFASVYFDLFQDRKK
jgi:predicted anti-sigma-YlaC factor YlaD